MRHVSLLAVVVMAMTAAPGFAQLKKSADPARNMLYDFLLAEATALDPLQVTAGRQPESQYQVPQSVTVLTGAEVDKISPQVIAEALAWQPGAFFQQSGPGQGIVIRDTVLEGTVVLERAEHAVPETVDGLVPFHSGERLRWRFSA